jgi:hypothetical protein
VKQRWLPVGLVALAIFVVNAVARFVSWKAHVEDESRQMTIGFIGVVVVALVLVGVAARWAVRHPFPRLLGDLGLATVVGALLSIIVGPYAGGSKPFVEGLGFFVGQFLLFLAVGVVGIILGFLGVVAFGKDWKSQRLLRAEQHYGGRQKTVRGAR